MRDISPYLLYKLTEMGTGKKQPLTGANGAQLLSSPRCNVVISEGSCDLRTRPGQQVGFVSLTELAFPLEERKDVQAVHWAVFWEAPPCDLVGSSNAGALVEARMTRTNERWHDLLQMVSAGAGLVGPRYNQQNGAGQLFSETGLVQTKPHMQMASWVPRDKPTLALFVVLNWLKPHLPQSEVGLGDVYLEFAAE